MTHVAPSALPSPNAPPAAAPVLTTRALPDSQFEGHAELQGVYGLYVHVLALTL